MIALGNIVPVFFLALLFVFIPRIKSTTTDGEWLNRWIKICFSWLTILSFCRNNNLDYRRDHNRWMNFILTKCNIRTLHIQILELPPSMIQQQLGLQKNQMNSPLPMNLVIVNLDSHYAFTLSIISIILRNHREHSLQHYSLSFGKD